MPAVSTKFILLPPYTHEIITESLVVPGKSLAITLFYFNNPLINVLFPTLGLPTIDNYNGFFFIKLSLDIYYYFEDVYFPDDVNVSNGFISLSESKSELSSGFGFILSNSLFH